MFGSFISILPLTLLKWCGLWGREQHLHTPSLHLAVDTPLRFSSGWYTRSLRRMWQEWGWSCSQVSATGGVASGPQWTSLPGPIPTLMMSAPERISSSTISPVTTFPAWDRTIKTVFSGSEREEAMCFQHYYKEESLGSPFRWVTSKDPASQAELGGEWPVSLLY